jgi:hypothetical protein
VVPSLTSRRGRGAALGRRQDLTATPRAPARGYLAVLVVLIAGIGLGVGFFVASLTSASSVTLPTRTDLSPRPAAALWGPIVHTGQPPADVLDNLSVPAGTTATGYDNRDAGVSQYDRLAHLFVPAGRDDVLGFYAVQLPGQGWKIRAATSTAGGHGRQVLAYRFSSDTFQWQAEVTVVPATRRGVRGTALTLEVWQLSEDEG